jgi:hypothetical protein
MMVKAAQQSSDTLVVRVSMTFRKRGGRRMVILPNGAQAPEATASRQQPVSASLKALVTAFRWRELLEGGVYAEIEEIAEAEGVNPSYASRIFRLTLLSPELVEAIVENRQPETLTLAKLLGPFPVEWEKQNPRLLPSMPEKH